MAWALSQIVVIGPRCNSYGIAAADWYRSSGEYCIALRMIDSNARGTFGRMCEGEVLGLQLVPGVLVAGR